MEINNELTAFKYIIIDTDVIDTLIAEGYYSFLEQSVNRSRIYTVGNSRAIRKLIEQSGGFEMSESLFPKSDSVWNSARSGNSFFENLSTILNVHPSQMRNQVLYIKSSKKQRVLLSRISNPSEASDYKVCNLRLVAYGVETCSFGCVYCFANYNFIQPTTILFDSPERVRVDLQNHQIRQSILEGVPIYLGSLADLFSPEALFFQIPQRMLVSLKGCRVFTVTKSPLIAASEIINALKQHGSIKVLFTYSNLSGFEKNIPLGMKVFPKRILEELVDSGLETILLYKPVIPGINDREIQIKRVLLQAVDVGIKEVSMGFLQMDPEMEVNLRQYYPRQYSYFNRVLTDKICDERLPPISNRRIAVNIFAKLCEQLGLRLSFCQAYVGNLEGKLGSAYCACYPERWATI